MEFNVGGEISGAATANSENSRHVGTVHTPEIMLSIAGVPITIDISVPIEAGYKFSASSHAHIGITAKANGNAKAGLNYDRGGGLQWVSDYNFQHSGALHHISGDASANLQLYLNPVINMEIEHMGGPVIGLKPYIEASASYDSDAMTGSCRKGQLQASSNWGLQASIGGRVDVEFGGRTLYKKSYPSVGIYSIKKPIKSGCITLPAGFKTGSSSSSSSSSSASCNDMKSSCRDWAQRYDCSRTYNFGASLGHRKLSAVCPQSCHACGGSNQQCVCKSSCESYKGKQWCYVTGKCADSHVGSTGKLWSYGACAHNTPPRPQCNDKSRHCPSWARNYYCNHQYNFGGNEEYLRSVCPKSCGRCSSGYRRTQSLVEAPGSTRRSDTSMNVVA